MPQAPAACVRGMRARFTTSARTLTPSAAVAPDSSSEARSSRTSSLIDHPEPLRDLDGWLRRRLRQVRWKEWKRYPTRKRHRGRPIVLAMTAATDAVRARPSRGSRCRSLLAGAPPAGSRDAGAATATGRTGARSSDGPRGLRRASSTAADGRCPREGSSG